MTFLGIVLSSLLNIEEELPANLELAL